LRFNAISVLSDICMSQQRRRARGVRRYQAAVRVRSGRVQSRRRSHLQKRHDGLLPLSTLAAIAATTSTRSRGS
jgi:hypothetical protein